MINLLATNPAMKGMPRQEDTSEKVMGSNPGTYKAFFLAESLLKFTCATLMLGNCFIVLVRWCINVNKLRTHSKFHWQLLKMFCVRYLEKWSNLGWWIRTVTSNLKTNTKTGIVTHPLKTKRVANGCPPQTVTMLIKWMLKWSILRPFYQT